MEQFAKEQIKFIFLCYGFAVNYPHLWGFYEWHRLTQLYSSNFLEERAQANIPYVQSALERMSREYPYVEEGDFTRLINDYSMQRVSFPVEDCAGLVSQWMFLGCIHGENPFFMVRAYLEFNGEWLNKITPVEIVREAEKWLIWGISTQKSFDPSELVQLCSQELNVVPDQTAQNLRSNMLLRIRIILMSVKHLRSRKSLLALYHSDLGDVNDPDILTEIGRWYEDQGNLSKAEEFYRKAYEKDPESSTWCYNLALIKAKQEISDKEFCELACKAFEKNEVDALSLLLEYTFCGKGDVAFLECLIVLVQNYLGQNNLASSIFSLYFLHNNRGEEVRIEGKVLITCLVQLRDLKRSLLENKEAGITAEEFKTEDQEEAKRELSVIKIDSPKDARVQRAKTRLQALLNKPRSTLSQKDLVDAYKYVNIIFEINNGTTLLCGKGSRCKIKEIPMHLSHGRDRLIVGAQHDIRRSIQELVKQVYSTDTGAVAASASQ